MNKYQEAIAIRNAYIQTEVGTKCLDDYYKEKFDILQEACEKAANYDSLRTPKKVQIEKTMTFNDVPLPTLYQLRVTCSCGEVFYCDGVQYWKTIPDKNGEFKKDGKLKMEYRFCPHCGQKMKL